MSPNEADSFNFSNGGCIVHLTACFMNYNQFFLSRHSHTGKCNFPFSLSYTLHANSGKWPARRYTT
jgi:hypothetical protein